MSSPTIKRKRCPNGHKKQGDKCVPKGTKSKSRCPSGSRKNKQGECIKKRGSTPKSSPMPALKTPTPQHIRHYHKHESPMEIKYTDIERVKQYIIDDRNRLGKPHRSAKDKVIENHYKNKQLDIDAVKMYVNNNLSNVTSNHHSHLIRYLQLSALADYLEQHLSNEITQYIVSQYPLHRADYMEDATYSNFLF